MLPRAFAFFLPVALVLAGCEATSEFMRPVVPPRALEPRADAATVVFLRPSSYARTDKFTIFDEQGRFVGESLPTSQFAVLMPPGNHVFVASGENTGALKAELGPGRTYYVEVAPRLGFTRPRVHLLAIGRHAQSFEHLRVWLDEAKQYAPLSEPGQAAWSLRKGEVTQMLLEANDSWAKFDTEERQARTLVLEDGIELKLW